MPSSIGKNISCRLFLFVTFLAVAASCRNKVQDQLAQENLRILKLQNSIIKEANLTLRNELTEMTQNGQIRLGYIYQPYLDNLYKQTDLCLAGIDSAKRYSHLTKHENLFTYYEAFQMAIRQLDSSFSFRIHPEDTLRFTYLDKTKFQSKYQGSSDSFDAEHELLLLESNVLINHSYMLRGVFKCAFYNLSRGQPIAIAISKKVSYKKGENLVIMAFLAKYDETMHGIATFGGHEVTSSGGFFKYSRKITEPAGLYKVPVNIKRLNSYDTLKVYPTFVEYQVK